MKYIIILFFVVSFFSCAPKQLNPHYGARDIVHEDIYSNDFIAEKNSEDVRHIQKVDDTIFLHSEQNPLFIEKSKFLQKAVHYNKIPKIKSGKKYLYKQVLKKNDNNDTATSGFLLLLFSILFFGLAYLFYYVIGTILGIILGLIFAIAAGVYLLGAFLALLRSIF